ncbi:YbhB/YbcL family Raf kinase inhibitor-like protein [Candidatus Parcubacteria bacterium]|nr:MAG: YbhB/YbcL family Raf kinase inhibitor-like protein [Candidatus Parcubacteria bacterium]
MSMRKIFFLIFGLVIVGAGCSSAQVEDSQGEDTTGVADPAVVYCEEQGGEIKIAENEEESTSYCVFPDGGVCEEWAYYNGECDPQEKSVVGNMQLTSTVFENEGAIPTKYSCDGSDINPSLTISGVTKDAKSLALVVDDPDAPGGTWVHWLVWNIDPSTTEISENSIPTNALQGLNSSGMTRYEGMCPPSGTHRYYFKLYALDTELSVSNGSSAADLEKAMEGHVLEEVELMGTYSY